MRVITAACVPADGHGPFLYAARHRTPDVGRASPQHRRRVPDNTRITLVATVVIPDNVLDFLVPRVYRVLERSVRCSNPGEIFAVALEFLELTLGVGRVLNQGTKGAKGRQYATVVVAEVCNAVISPALRLGDKRGVDAQVLPAMKPPELVVPRHICSPKDVMADSRG